MTLHRYLFALAAIAAAAVIAGCGSDATSPSASSSTSHPTQGQSLQAAVSFAGCMRSHGVPFPDPTTSPHGFKSAFAPNSALERSPGFELAYKRCEHLLPAGGPRNQSPTHTPAQVDAMRAFARCIRGHGFPSFPDPTVGGDLTHEMVASAGINLHQPAVLQAGDACVSVTHGVITRAIVARFVAGQ
jgi:hypothetical protein